MKQVSRPFKSCLEITFLDKKNIGVDLKNPYIYFLLWVYEPQIMDNSFRL
jgi:hypothetical protein